MQAAEAWFANLNWAMQQRVMQVIDDDEAMTHVLTWFPPPFLRGKEWVFPFKGDPGSVWSRQDLAAIRRFVKSPGVVLRLKKQTRGDRLALTDLVLAERERARKEELARRPKVSRRNSARQCSALDDMVLQARLDLAELRPTNRNVARLLKGLIAEGKLDNPFEVTVTASGVGAATRRLVRDGLLTELEPVQTSPHYLPALYGPGKVRL